jgi:hypothetical protein
MGSPHLGSLDCQRDELGLCVEANRSYSLATARPRGRANGRPIIPRKQKAGKRTAWLDLARVCVHGTIAGDLERQPHLVLSPMVDRILMLRRSPR